MGAELNHHSRGMAKIDHPQRLVCDFEGLALRSTVRETSN
jgi:hypothetical protein